MSFLNYIKSGDATKATALVEAVLKQKTLAAIKDQRETVAEGTYGLPLDDEDVDEELTEETHKGLAFYKQYKAKGKTKGGYTHFEHPEGHILQLKDVGTDNELHWIHAKGGQPKNEHQTTSGFGPKGLLNHLEKFHTKGE